MPGRMTTPLKVIRDHINASVEAKMQVIVDTFCNVGEQCIIEARDGGTYEDQSGNLRSSIGYAVVWDGKVVTQAQVEKTKDGDQGIIEGAEFLEKLIKKAKKKGVVLIVSAGMNYAVYVEELHGRNVLASAELKAGPLVRSLLTQLGFTIK